MADAGGKTLADVQVGTNAPCPLLSNVDRDHATLKDVLDAMQTDLETIVISSQVPIDLSGAGVTQHVFVADRAYTLTAANFVFTEASSADAGSNLSVGKVFIGTDDVDYFVNEVASEASKETGYRQVGTLLQTAVAEGDVMTIVSAGGKTGIGEVIIQLELTKT